MAFVKSMNSMLFLSISTTAAIALTESKSSSQFLLSALNANCLIGIFLYPPDELILQKVVSYMI